MMAIKKVYMTGHEIIGQVNCIWDKFGVEIPNQSKVMTFGTVVAFLIKVYKPLQTSYLSVLFNIRATCM